MPGFTLVEVRAAVRKLIRDTGSTKVFPNDPDFDEPFIRQALQMYSGRKPRSVPFYELQITAGTREYTLPADWLRKDEESWRKAYGSPAKRFQYEPYPGANLTGGIYPPAWAATGAELRWLDEQQRLIIHPAPVATATITFDYLAVHSIDQSDATKTTVGALDQMVIEKLTAANVLKAIAVEKSVLQKYKLLTGLEVDDSKAAETLLANAERYEKDAVNHMVRPVLMRG